jgi:hypothetical protein
MIVTRPAAARAADGIPVIASDSQQAPARDPAVSIKKANLRLCTILPSTKYELRNQDYAFAVQR